MKITKDKLTFQKTLIKSLRITLKLVHIKMLVDEFEQKDVEINLRVPEGWNLHINGKKDHVFLINPEREEIIFKMDNMPYLCVSEILVYLLYQLHQFIKIKDLTVTRNKIESHSDVEVEFKLSTDEGEFKGAFKLVPEKYNLRLVGGVRKGAIPSIEDIVKFLR